MRSASVTCRRSGLSTRSGSWPTSPFPAQLEKERRTDDATIVKRVELFSSYKDFIDQQKYAEAFDSRSNLHSSVLEEFVYYLFRDLVSDAGGAATVGKAATFKDVFFAPPSYAEMVRDPFARIEKKDHDFVIGANVTLDIRCTGSKKHQEEQVRLPAVAIECKTYLDKAMLEGSSTAAEQIRSGLQTQSMSS